MANYSYEKNAATKLPKEQTTLTQQVYDTLKNEIIAGKLEPGYRLVRRKESKRLGVSRMAITEALLKLEIDGFVESRPKFGSRVKPLTLDEVRNDEVLREALECQAARLAAENATQDQFDKLMKKAVELDGLMKEKDRNSKKGMQLHFDFHLDLAKASGYQRFAEELKRVWFRRLMRINWIKATKFKKPPEKWHQIVIETCKSKNPAKAEQQMRKHVRYDQESNSKALKMMLQYNSDSR